MFWMSRIGDSTKKQCYEDKKAESIEILLFLKIKKIQVSNPCKGKTNLLTNLVKILHKINIYIYKIINTEKCVSNDCEEILVQTKCILVTTAMLLSSAVLNSCIQCTTIQITLIAGCIEWIPFTQPFKYVMNNHMKCPYAPQKHSQSLGFEIQLQERLRESFHGSCFLVDLYRIAL